MAIDLKQRIREIEAHFVSEAIREAGTQKAAARLLGISQQMISKVLAEAGGGVGEDEGILGKS